MTQPASELDPKAIEAAEAPPQILSHPGPDYGVDSRRFQGIPSLACVSDLHLLAVWYGGKSPGEDENNYVVLAESTDGGEHWSSEILAIEPGAGGPVRAFDPEIWLAPDGRVWFFWAQGVRAKYATRSGVWGMHHAPGGDFSKDWSVPRRLCDGVMMCKPLAFSDGRWGLPVSIWHHRQEGSAALWTSSDQGETWQQAGAADVAPEERSYDEHMLVERRDRSLWMWVRTRRGIAESTSVDGGAQWSPLQPSAIPHVDSRFFIRRLASGNLLLVRHHPADGSFASPEGKGKRSHLSAFLSTDDGQHWEGGLLLDERLGVSYPDGDQAPDGTIHIVYDFDRRGAREILTVALREEEILRGGSLDPERRIAISKPPTQVEFSSG